MIQILYLTRPKDLHRFGSIVFNLNFVYLAANLKTPLAPGTTISPLLFLFADSR